MLTNSWISILILIQCRLKILLKAFVFKKNLCYSKGFNKPRTLPCYICQRIIYEIPGYLKKYELSNIL